MKITSILLALSTLLYLYSPQIHAQQIPLNGTISIQNSAFETGKVEYVSNVTIEDLYGQAQTTLSNSNGEFTLTYVNVKYVAKVLDLIMDIQKHPFEGIGNPEALKSSLESRAVSKGVSRS